MASKKVNIDIQTTANTSGAKQAEKSLDSVAASANRVTKSNANLDSSAQKVTDTTQGASRGLLIFSQGLEDAQYGIRGVLNNIPGLVMAIGGGAGLAGAISIAAVSISFLSEKMAQFGAGSETTAEKAQRLADIIKEIEKNANDLSKEDLDMGRSAMESALSLAGALATDYEILAARENAFSSQALKNAEMLRQAEANLRAARGETISQIDEVTAKADEEAAKRKQEMQAAINSENARVNAARQNLTLSEESLEIKTQALKGDQESADQLRAEIDLLRDKRKELEKIAKQTVTTGFGPGAGLGTAPVFASSPQARDAQRQLASGNIDADIAAKIGELETLVESAETATGAAIQSVQRAGIGVMTAQKEFNDAQAAALANIAQIQSTFEASDIQGSTAALLQTQTALAAEIKTAIETAQPRTEADRANVEALKGIIKDGEVRVNETTEAINALGQLQAVIPTAMGEVNNNVQELIGIMRQMQTQSALQAREIEKLKEKQNTILPLGR